MRGHDANLGFEHQARKAATSFALRWNVGVYTFTRIGAVLSCLASSLPTFTATVAPPVARVSPPIDLAAFQSATPFVPPGPWTVGDILQFLPSGSAGPDGATSLWLSQCHFDSLGRLTKLNDWADVGVVPSGWSQARACFIPKSADAPPNDLRPITVLSILYRLWARRHSAAINLWLASWAPPGLMGAMKNRSASTATNQATDLIDAAAMGIDPTLFLLSLDQAKCFDRLHLKTLSSIVECLGVPALKTALQVYSTLGRHMYLHGQPTQYYLHGDGVTGIPQGCPLACTFCNLTAIAWLFAARSAVPNCIPFSYLDDRLVLTRSWRDLNKVLEATHAVDLALGPVLNLSKSFCSLVVQKGQRRFGPPRNLLKDIKFVPNFKYLGVDICCHSRAKRPVATSRAADYADRMQLIQSLPSSQREWPSMMPTQRFIAVVVVASQLLIFLRWGTKRPQRCSAKNLLAKSGLATQLISWELVRTKRILL